MNGACDQSQLSKTPGCDWTHATFIEGNFSKLTNNQKFFGKYVESKYDILIHMPCDDGISVYGKSINLVMNAYPQKTIKKLMSVTTGFVGNIR